MRTKSSWWTLAALGAALPVLAQAQPARNFGAGAVLGRPIGGTAKLWLNADQAVDLGIGYGGGAAAFWGDWLWHFQDSVAQPAQGALLPYAGLGPRFEVGDDPKFGIRTMLGLSYSLAAQPIEFFAEAGPVFRVTQGGHVDADGGVGARYYFGGQAPR
ncbi:MAG: hypothetical protein HY552_06100 [Elusimicrobia bacterium]|nr:hypothetical protein [Elusimicrobiota bacterium]